MSLRARLLIGMALVALVLAVSGVAVTRIIEAHLIDQVDADLEGVRVHGDRLAVGSRAVFSELWIGQVDEDGTLVARTPPNLFGDVPPPPEIDGDEAVAAARRGRAFTVGSTESDLRYRALAQRFPGPGGGVLVWALPLDDVDGTVGRLIAVELAATLTILGVLTLVTWWVIRLGVKPLKRMTATATAIAAGDMSQRVPEEEPGTEAGDLGAALNQMMGHIEAAFDQRTQSENRLRQFIADASHELRTPVTTVRGYAELYQAGGLGDADELDEAMRRTGQEAVRMGTLIDDLLLLARLDQGRPLERRPVELTALADDAVRDARAVEPDRPITATTNGPVTVVGDDARLRQVIANLVGNALVHTPAGTPVDIRVSRTGDRAVVEVVDRGPGMAPEVAARAFERFYRADPSRSRHRGGSGLGLAIVQATVSAHGGEVSLDSAPGQGTTVRVDLPAAPNSA
jgi:two-component system OmpR family sensor kinase